MVWEIRKRVMGGKKAVMESTAIVNPKTNRLAVNKEEVKSASLQYCVDTLKNNEPEEHFKHILKRKRGE